MKNRRLMHCKVCKKNPEYVDDRVRSRTCSDCVDEIVNGRDPMKDPVESVYEYFVVDDPIESVEKGV
jgi:hypothetical protein